MVSILESLQDGQQLSLHDALDAGLDVLSGSQEVTFVPYIRQVLPIDGFVFWMRADLLSDQQLASVNLSAPLNQTISGSLHYSSVGSQDFDESIVIRRVDFTAQQQITAFAEIASSVLYIAEWNTHAGKFKFTFSSRNSYYVQANLHHYVGDAVYPVFEAQLIETLSDLDDRQVVSNSLPIWLRMVQAPPFPETITSNLPLFPAYLVPDNLPPPYGAVYIAPSSTRPLQAMPILGHRSSHSQLMTENVKFDLYGLRNDEALDFLDYLIGYSELTGDFGVMTPPVLKDELRTQVELGALAQKKTLELGVSYYQSSARDLARQVIKTAVPSFEFNPHPTRREC